MSLQSHIKDKSLIRRLQGIVEYIQQRYLRFWQVHAPHFTDHGTTHCENIISILDRMIPSSVMEEMDEYEIFLLLDGVWLHDIGMLVKRNNLTPDKIRKTHHESGRSFIRNYLGEIYLSDDDKYVLGEMAFYHRKAEDISTAKEIIGIQHNSSSVKVRVRFLCAILRLADGCEIAHSRSSMELMDIAGLDAEDRFHHEAHLHVSSVDFEPDKHEIIIYLRVKTQQDGELLTKYFKSNLEKELSSVRDILKENGIDYRTIQCDVTIDSYARELPSIPIKPEKKSLDEYLVEFENKTGFYPSMAINQADKIHIFYETISQTRRELQQEIISILKQTHNIFTEKRIVILTVSKIHDPKGTVGDVDPEIITVLSKSEHFKDYHRKKLDKREFWNRLEFFQTHSFDQFRKLRRPKKWRLAIE